MSTYFKHRFADIRLPFIVGITHYTPQSRDGASVENWHENVEILLIIDGSGIIRLDDRAVTVTGGDIVVVNHNVIHSITPADELLYHYIIVDRAFCISNHFDTNTICFEEHIRDAQLFSMFREITEAFYAKKDTSYGVQSIRARVLLAMAQLCKDHSDTNKTYRGEDYRLMSCIRQALGYINAESNKDISLDEIANFVGLSKYYFAREFKKVTGYTFVSYVNIARCERAKSMLIETSASIGAISAACGFSDQSYFTKVFKKHVGVSPVEFRQRK